MPLLPSKPCSCYCPGLQAVRELLRKALSSPLLPSQQQALLALLDADPQLVHALQLQPQQLPLLVEHTPMLAYQILLRMLGSRQLAALQQVGGLNPRRQLFSTQCRVTAYSDSRQLSAVQLVYGC